MIIIKHLLFLIIFILFIQIVISGDWAYDSREIVVNLKISSSAELVPTSPSYTLRYVNVNLSLFPYEDYNQRVIDISTTPEAKKSERIMQFTWESPKETKIGFEVDSTVNSFNRYKPVYKKVTFPIEIDDKELLIYTLPSRTIDSDNMDIIRKASELASGETDLFEVVFKIGEWTKSNVRYDLSTLTASVSQKASWVYKNREGVCDELASLFIAMLRALGIPARFVTGVAYTDSELFPVKWGAHGWAEVYFPEYGWIPFDVTYGQYGYVDGTHIKLKEAVDPDEPSSDYEWLGANIALKTSKLNVDADVIETIGSATQVIEIKSNVFKHSTGFGSYNLVVVSLRNLADYYTSTEIYIAKPGEVDILDEDIKAVMLKPNENKSLFWIIRLSETLDDKFIYTLPISVVTLNNISSFANFTASTNERVYSLNEINNTLHSMLEEEKSVYSRNVELSCDIDRKEIYEDEKAVIECNVRNSGNVFLDNLSLCFKEDCHYLELGIARTYNHSFSVSGYSTGKQDVPVTAKNEDVSKAEYVDFVVLDKPNISIDDIYYPEIVSYDDRFVVNFTLKKNSKSDPLEVKLRMIQDFDEKKWEMDEFDNDRIFMMNFDKGSLFNVKNRFHLTVDYKDALGRNYSAKEQFVISLRNVNLIQRIAMMLNRIGGRIANLLRMSD